jgi:hypothetical protein
MKAFNFLRAGMVGALALGGAAAFAQDGVLENPGEASFQSGIGLISGWHCDATSIELEIDGTVTLDAAYGTERTDTESVCGDANNGWGALFAFSLLDSGEHELIAYADGVEFGRSTFTVTQLSTGQFITGVSSEVTVPNFPEAGKSVTLVWQQANQNFLIKSESGGDASGPQVVFDEGEVDPVWNAGIQAFDEQIGFASCADKGEECPSVGWDFVFDIERGPVLEVTYAGPGLAGLFFAADPSTDLSAYAGGTLSFDILVTDEGNNTSGFTAKADCIFPCTSGDQALGVVGLGGWETVTMDVDQLVGGGLDLSKVNTGLVIFPNAGEQTGVVFRLDNIFWAPAP